MTTLSPLLPIAQQGASRVLFTLGETQVTIARLVTALAFLLLGVVLARITGRVLERVVERRTRGMSKGTLRSSVRLIQYAILVTGLLIALQTLGVRLAALFAAGALFAVALGFAMQNVVANFVSGVILLLERSIKPGDIVEVNDQIVKIKEMGIRAAIARTLDEEDLIIPSSQLVQSTVRNYTLRDPITRLRVVVGVIYDSDMALVRKTLEETARGVPWRLPDREPVVLMRQFGSSSVDFEVSVWFDDPWNRMRRSSDLHEAIWWALKEAGVTIAFPQLDVHLDRPALDALAARGRREGE
ncbi:MAG: mechanosensitive ion channel [Gemmatimonadota bacterium]|nr:mechanosensitive ion channel [Gemmatimonadota bacterium]